MKKLLNDDVIKKIRNVWGDEYDLSKVDYINARKKIIIICKKHGEFEIKLHDLLNGHGCKKCAFEKISKEKVGTTIGFIKKAKLIHGNKYDYSKVKYVNSHEKVCIICPEHGEFWQLPGSHLNGFGCSKCSGNNHKTTEEFIDRAKQIHGDKYDYSKVEYINNHTKICITCPEHGEFWQTPNAHLNGQGCNLCNKPVYNTETFIIEAKKIHGNKYDYSKVNYINSKSKICIICPEHGEFWQTPSSHLQSIGCPLCNMSHLEALTMNYLNKKGIKYEYQCNKNILPFLNMQRLDFYLPDYKIAIECQGIQHFKPIDFFGGEKNFKYITKLDENKKNICDSNGISLIYICNEDEIINKLSCI